jgi:hypothetical protein
MLHTKEGGEKKLKLGNGKVVQITVPETSTWLLDATTGEVLLPLKGKSEH